MQHGISGGKPQRLPGGVARSDYSRPCPGCGEAIKQGQRVTRVALERTSWWHESCRSAEVQRLLVLSPDGDTFRARYDHKRR